jgi:hypothetical protein
VKVTGPLFKVYGSKWSSSKLLPPPTYDKIVEPFAGGAGYALRHCEKNVILYERHYGLYPLWFWLINTARESDVREIPINAPSYTDIRSLGMCYGQALLLKWWQRTNNYSPTWETSAWGNKPGQWTANTRARVSEEISAIKHWTLGGDQCILSDRGSVYMHGIGSPATWFIDPPYEGNFQYGGPAIDYVALAAACRVLPGQVIVCEAVNPKTGKVPTWLPFEPWKKRVTSRRSVTAGNGVYSSEMIYELHNKDVL